jgi:tripartite-type tricarboxylate transporter receptor subunit TctC
MHPSAGRTRAIAAASFIICAALAGTAWADDYYKGKTIRIVVGSPSGGGYDAYARLVGRHLPNFIPGKPTVIVSNMQGASGTKAASYLYSIAPKDGTVIATFNKSMPLYQALGQTEIAFKTEQMSWIASISQTADIVTVWHKSGVKSIADAKRREVVMGSDSASGTMTAYPALLNATLGTKFKIVQGYAGSTAVNFAMEQGEVEGRGSNPWSSWKATKPDWVKDGLITPLVQVGFKKEPDLPHVPTLIDLAENDEQKVMFTFVSASVAIERPFAGPPGMAPEALGILRSAFNRMVKDSAFLAEAARSQMDVDPHTGEEVAKIVADMIATSPAIVQKVKEITATEEAKGGDKPAAEKE